MKKIITLLVLCLAFQTQNVYGIAGDSTNIKSMKPFAWEPISGVSKILQFENKIVF